MRDIYKRVAPHIDRVRYDGGTETRNMADLFQLQRLNEELKDYLKLSYCPELTGNKIRVSGVNNYVSKGYSTDAIQKQTGNDLTQSTAVNQPYLDKIAPTEKLGAKNPNGVSAYLSYNSISFGSTEPWSLTTVFNWNGDKDAYIYLIGDAANNGVILRFSSVNRFGFNLLSGAYPNVLWDVNSTNSIIGKTIAMSLVYDGSYLELFLNGVSLGKKAWDKAAAFTSLLSKVVYQSSQKNYYLAIHSKAISSTQINSIHSCLKSIFPEIESVQIGTQTWAVRNFEAVCTPQGNLTPEVQSAATWATSQTLYDNAYAAQSGTIEQKTYAGVKAAAMWCHYNNDPANGAIYGKLYNWFAVKLLQMDIDYYNAANPTTPWGWRVPTQADFTTLSTYLGGNAVSGGKLKLAGTAYWETPNTGADNSSGFSAICVGYRDSSGVFSAFNYNNDYLTDSSYKLRLRNDSASSLITTNPTLYGGSLRLIKV